MPHDLASTHLLHGTGQELNQTTGRRCGDLVIHGGNPAEVLDRRGDSLQQEEDSSCTGGPYTEHEGAPCKVNGSLGQGYSDLLQNRTSDLSVMIPQDQDDIGDSIECT